MSGELDFLSRAVATGKLSRRDFLGRAAALGVGAAVANTMLATAARAQTPQKGGALKMGLVGGESTNSLDPAQFLTQVPQNFGSTWGELLVLQSPEDGSAQPVLAESWDASDDASEWAFKIRKGVTFHNGKDLTPEDVAQTIRRHSDENTKSAALGVLGDIDEVVVDGDNVVFKLKRGNADLPLLLGVQPGQQRLRRGRIREPGMVAGQPRRRPLRPRAGVGSRHAIDRAARLDNDRPK